MSKQQAFVNRLIHETSPYLRQHAHNPVDWYSWGTEALERARQLDRPIFLSIGYSACHWCHVMEHESFEDPEVAAILNEHFVSIKVDREERPDLDHIYMTAVQMMTGHGGWPMSVFLTPELKPFYGGTYFPPDDRHGQPSFKRLLATLVDAWGQRREEIVQTSGQLTDNLRLAGRLEPSTEEPGPDLLRHALVSLQRSFDSTYGGFGSAPKFPHPMELRLLLRIWKRFGDEDALRMAQLTFDRMAMGGIYDHLGGGFHRYSTDERWLVPHFEKMLCDNALLSLAYLEAYQATGAASHRRVVEETLDYVLREMTSPEGFFYSTQDADSEGEEGKFFVWSAQEVQNVLGKEQGEVAAYVYDIIPSGNWEGNNILHRTKTEEQDARILHLSEAEMQSLLREAKAKLFAIRSQRVWPARDEKTLTSWNGLMIDALAQAAQVLGVPAYRAAAVKAAEFVLSMMRADDGRLFRTYSSGSKPKLSSCLDDYAFFVNALVSLYEATFEIRWIESALSLSGVMIDQFWDTADAGFFYTGRSHEQLIARTKDVQDSSIPSGNSMAALALLRIAKLTGRRDLKEKAEITLRAFGGLMASSPLAVGQMLVALDFHVGPVTEFAILGDPAEPEVEEALQLVRKGFRPNKVVALQATAAQDARTIKLVPLLAEKTSRGALTTYICKEFACQAPLVGIEALRAALEP
ncbi:MAG TPA: thioredoxin domain-containing protein [Gemmataceae bacterium]|nr:thioredoxin domain-containing protein [Gemmataceae bacterium]